MSSGPPSPGASDTEDQFGRIGDLSSIMDADAETLDDYFRDLSPLLDSEDESFLGIESSQVAWSSQATKASSLGSSQPTHSTPNDTPESSNPAPTHQGVRLVLPDVPTLYSQSPSGPGSQENSNEDNALNCEAAETSSLGTCTGGFGGGILENGNPFDLCARPQPEREIGRYYHYNPQDRSFVNYTQENLRLFSSRESQPAAPAASSSDDTPMPPPPAPKKKPSAVKERSKPAKRPRRKTVTRREPKREPTTIAPRPAVRNTPTATNWPHMPPPPPPLPIAVNGTSRSLNGYGDGYDTRGFVSPQVQFNHLTMNGNMLNNMGYPSMPQNASFVNGNGNSVDRGTMPQRQLHGVQNHFISRSINNDNIYMPPTPMLNNANGLMGGPIDGPNAFAPCHSANTSRQHDMVFGGNDVPALPELSRSRQKARDMGTPNFAQYDRSSMGGDAAGLNHTSGPSSNPWGHIDDGALPIRRPRSPPGETRWAPSLPASRGSSGGNIMGGFSQSTTPGYSPMGSMEGTSDITTPGMSLLTQMSSSPPDPESMSRREFNGRTGSSSMFLNNLSGANNRDQNGYSYHPYDPRRYRQDNRVHSKGKR